MQRIKSSFSTPLLVLVVFGLLVSSRYINTEALQFQDNIYLSMIILQILIFAFPGIFYCKLRGNTLKKNIHLKPLSAHKIGFIFCSFGLLVFGSILLNTATFYIFGSQSQSSLYDTFTPTGIISLTNIAYIIITFAILPAFTEEFVFRGIVQSEYTDYGVGIAIVISSLMFAMLHFNLKQFIVYFYCGVILSYTVYITQSIWAGVILHFLNNLYGLFGEFILWDAIKSPNSLIFFLFVIMTLFIVFLVLSFNGAEKILYTNGIKGDDSPPEAQKREGGIKLWFEVLVSPSLIACVILFLVTTLLL